MSRKKLLLATGVAVAAVLFRSYVFLGFEQSHFDSDQAVLGIMGIQIAALRDFPVFMYGQQYFFALESWLAAPLIAVFGPSVGALKFPNLIVNLASAILLVHLLVKEVGLTPWKALLCASVFVFPPVVSASRMSCLGGYAMCALGTLLIWRWRNSYWRIGLLVGVLYLQRPFIIYPVVALLLIEVWEGRLLDRRGLRLKMVGLLIAVILVFFLRKYGIGPENVGRGGAPALKIRGLWSTLEAISDVITSYLPIIFELRSTELIRFNIRSSITTGSFLFTALSLVAIAFFGRRMRKLKGWESPKLRFPVFLVLTSVISAGAVAIIPPDGRDQQFIRYTMLSLFLPVGLFPIYWYMETNRRLIRFSQAYLAIWLGVIALGHSRLIAEYTHRVPPNPHRELAEFLLAKGLRYGSTDFWTAYPSVFFTNEEIVLSDHTGFIRRYSALVNENADGAVRIGSSDCSNLLGRVHEWRICR